jgi:2-amino-4-hydroxy-6-hydroxymethyldihydropteridine diphosphokinase
MNNVFLSLGSNLGDRLEFLQIARTKIISRVGALIQSSSIYETEPWGYSDTHLYLNQVIQIETELDPEGILSCIGEIELSMGRVRGKDRYVARVIDIDILLYGMDVFFRSNLTIPHPEIANRRFILVPFSEIAGDMIHPVNRRTIKELLERCKDGSQVKVLKME